MKLPALIRITPVLIIMLLVNACGGPADTPEARVEAFVKAAEEAAEQRSLDFFKDSIAEQYSDNHGLKRKELLRMLTGYFFRNQSIHIVSRITELQIVDEAYAEVVVFVAMAGSPEAGFDQILQMRGDTYRVELDLIIDDRVQVLRANWQQSTPAEAFDQ